MRGETALFSLFASYLDRSPLTRGKGSWCLLHDDGYGYTPRLRGVKVVIMKENALDIGTPPLTRGKDTKYEKIENVSPGAHQ